MPEDARGHDRAPAWSSGSRSRRQSRAWLPVEIYPISAGVKGGLAGSVAMASLAVRVRDAEGGTASGIRSTFWRRLSSPSRVRPGPSSSAPSISTASPIACGRARFVSPLVGLLYGAMLPMLPRRPDSAGRLIAPLLWSGLLYGDPRSHQSGAEPAASTGSGSWCRRWRSASSRASSCVRQERDPDAQNLLVRVARRHRGARARFRRESREDGRDARRCARPARAARCRAARAVRAARARSAARRGRPSRRRTTVVEFGALYADNCSGCHGADGTAAPRSASPTRCTSRSPTSHDPRAHRRRRARHLDAGLRAEGRRHAHRGADRRARPRHPDRGAVPARSDERIRRPMRRTSAGDVRAWRSGVPDLLCVLPRSGKVRAGRGRAPSRTIRTSRW